ncbi:MAG: S8 family serine peptidase, partial [Thermoflexales bacterium]|nr:S8 family serine peptidase [Thermoflexales bacterium]
MPTSPRSLNSSRLSSLLIYLGVLTLTLCVLTSMFGAPAARAQLSESLTPTPDYSATPTYTSTPTPEVKSIEPTPTPVLIEATLTPEPEITASPEMPTPTPTASEPPTETPTPELIPTETPVLEATPTETTVLLTELTADAVPGQLIVKLLAGTSAADLYDLANDLDLYVLRYLPGVDAWLISGAPDRLAATIERLRETPSVVFVEQNYRTQVLADPVDPMWLDQTSLLDLQIPQAWDITTGSPDVVVAVIDTGLDMQHPELTSQVWINAGEDGPDDSGADKRTNGLDDDGNGYVDDWTGWNFAAANADVYDSQGHGTHLAGLIAAAANNSEGISGIAPGVRVMTLKATDDAGTGSYAQLIEALVYAADHGARVVNLSLGGDSPSQALQAAVDYAWDRNVLVVAASGGGPGSRSLYPAVYDTVISVGDTTRVAPEARMRQIGRSKIDLLAPGQDVLATWPGGYRAQSGSSVSAAQVSGIAALLASVSKFESAAAIREALLATALRGGSYGISDGALEQTLNPGLVQAYDALNYGEALTPAAPEAANIIWGQTSTVAAGCTIGGTAANAYTPASFDGLTATCAFTAAGTWTYNNLQDPLASLTTVDGAAVTVRLAVTNWVDDQIVIEASNNGTTWTALDTLAAANPPTSTLSFYTYNASAVYSTRALLVAAQVRFSVIPVGGLDAGLTIASDQVRITALNAYTPVATPTAPAPQPTVIPGPNDPHVAYEATTDKCAACHRVHTGAGLALRQAAPEENVCYTCHTANATPITATIVYTSFTAYTNTLTAFYKHDVALTNGVHRPGGGDSLGGANRHVECEDCHEAHEATRGAAAAPMIQRVMSGTTGVEPLFTSGSALPTFNFMPQAQREHQVCLKCHSNFTSEPTYQPSGWNGTALVANGLRKLTSANATQVLDSRNMAAEFNPYAASFHPVLAQGRNQAIPVGSFVTGWSQTSLVYCSDCHENNAAPAQGPHSSPLLHILAGTFNYNTVGATTANGNPGTPNA